MNNEATLEKMQSMRFYGMSSSLRSIIDAGMLKEMNVNELLTRIIDSEYDYRYNRRLKTLINGARFRINCSISDIRYDKHRNLDRDAIMSLIDGEWIKKGENIIISGATGVGKSFLACAIGNQACINGYKVSYNNTIKFFSDLMLSKTDGTYSKKIDRLLRNDLIILDDFGLHPIDNTISMILLEILEDRYNRKSIIISSQYSEDVWHSLIPDKTYADAICDRIIHKSHKIDLQGESMRKINHKKKIES